MKIIEVFSDAICPWCFVGKRRLEKALQLLASPPEIVWRPFELNLEMPPEGMPRRVYREAKFGSWEHSLALEQHVASEGAKEGIEFRFDLIARTPNTLDAHRIVESAARRGCQDAVVEALFRAYFIEGRDIGNRETLASIAGFVIDWSATADIAAVRAHEDRAAQLGIQGVPAFVRDGVLAASGAQPPAMLAESLANADSMSLTEPRA
jgi:predicted DsbA family dithiol-disulfide isomerase